jgi:hypothetical protein
MSLVARRPVRRQETTAPMPRPLESLRAAWTRKRRSAANVGCRAPEASTPRRHPCVDQRHDRAAAQGDASLGKDATEMLNADLAHHTLPDQHIA